MKLVYDIKLKRPGCALIQAVMGGDRGIANHFKSEHWLINPTPDLKLYETTPEELKTVILITEAAWKRKHKSV
jgi:hypothetical protein